jgi:hypothetical protein
MGPGAIAILVAARQRFNRDAVVPRIMVSP